MKKYPINLRIKPNAGFSIVDTMVGMVIAMLGMIIIFQVFSVSEGVKRTTTSGGDAQQTGAMALFTLERSLKEAGYGIFVNNVGALPNDNLASTAPVTITFGAANTPDTIAIVSRKNWDFGAFLPGAAVFLPPRPTTETISVDAQGQLVSVTSMTPNGTPPYPVFNPIVPDATAVIADGIALMKAQYGTDVNADGILQPGEWTTAVPVNPWNVLAVRLVVVARSAQPEKPSVAGGACDTTTVAPTWSGTALTPLLLDGQADLIAAGDDWACYRYKTFENTVYLRNVVWRP